jgi:HrpA-like RNA helicase
MDIIIALAKQSCFFNNTVRLIIVSATMDDDEPVYRRYFANINDNLLFPIKYPFNNLIINAIYLDRRYHISPPGETTQYNVEEFYLDNDPKDENIAQELAYSKIIEICNKTSEGEILFFANGKNEIIKATKYLNEKLPNGIIALPFFSELNDNYKNIISKINNKINIIKNKKENIYLEWRDKYIEDITVQNGIYKRAVIIATNVAEASITIPGLTYVIDNGYAKVNYYIPDLNKTDLRVDKISESSRIQRRGRVGRIGDGIVHYMYKKNARKDIKPKYQITQQEIVSSIILKLLCNMTNDEINIKYKDSNKILFPYNSKNSKLIEIYNQNYRINNMPIDFRFHRGKYKGLGKAYPKINQEIKVPSFRPNSRYNFVFKL